MAFPRTVLQAFHDQTARMSDRPFLWSRRGHSFLPTSFRDVALRVKRLALALAAAGFEKGSIAGTWVPSGEEEIAFGLAAMALGGVALHWPPNSDWSTVVADAEKWGVRALLVPALPGPLPK